MTLRLNRFLRKPPAASAAPLPESIVVAEVEPTP